MKWYYTRAELNKIDKAKLKTIHKKYIWVVFSILFLLSIVSLLSIWEVLPSWGQYIVFAGVLVLWPWISITAFIARKLK